MELNLFYVFEIVFVILVSVFLYEKNKRQRAHDYLDLFTIFSAAYFLYCSIGTYAVIGNYYNKLYVPILFYISAILGYSAFALGYICFVNRRNDATTIQTKIGFGLRKGILINKGRVSIIDLVMLIIFAFFILINHETFITMITNFGIGESYEDVKYREARTALSGPINLINSYFPIFLVGYPSYRMFKTGKISFFDLFIFVILGMYSITSGHRTTLVLLGFAVLTFINYRYKLLGFGKLICLGVCALLFMVILGHVRASSDITGMITRLMEGGSDLAKLTSSGEFINTVGTCLKYIEEIAVGRYEFNYGYAWIAEVLIFIPYFLWKGRPIPWAEQYMVDFYPLAPEGTGHGWFVLNDGYMSFGILGVILEMFVIGVVLAKVYSFFIKNIRIPIFHIMYIVLLKFTFLMIRTGFLSTVKNYILEIAPFILIIIITKIKVVKGRNYSNAKK